MSGRSHAASPHLDVLRWRLSLLLLGGVSIGSTAFIISMTVTAIVAERITGTATWSGVPVAACVLGTAVGTSALSMVMTRWNRRQSLSVFYVIAGVGGLVAAAAPMLQSLPLLIVGVFVLGFGNSANALTRYIAADLHAPARRATMLGWVVWAGTIGAVVGPNVLAPSDRLGVSLGLPGLSGPYVLCALTFFGAAGLYIALLRPDPSAFSPTSDSHDPPTDQTHDSMTALFRLPQVQVSVVALVFGHVAMVLIMTMTPLHLQSAGHGLVVIGLVASSHIVGMFLFAPLTGLLVDRLGALPVIVLGQGILLATTVGGMVVSVERPVLIGILLFCLGLGWNLGFVAGSANLTRGIRTPARGVLQGRTDSLIWISAATASLVSSVLFSTSGFVGLCAVGAIVVLCSLTTILVRGRTIAAPRVAT